MSDNNFISPAKAAETLGISIASLKNWEKHEYLKPHKGDFRRSEIEDLLEKIKSGEINRLGSRANKKQSKGRISPSPEYADICLTVSELNTGIDQIMFLLSMKLFMLHGLIKPETLTRLLDFSAEDYHSSAVRTHMKNRYDKLCSSAGTQTDDFHIAAKTIFKLELPRDWPADTDVAGIVYQALCSRGNRSVSGSFYTPPDIAENMTESARAQLPADTEPVFIDPCCGTGQFLLSFIKAGGKPENAWGIDSDYTAALTTAANIILQCPEIDFQPHIFCADSLTEAERFANKTSETGFDLVITNPPWGACTAGKSSVLKNRFQQIKSGESFSYFICRALELTKNEGIISVVLPESITNVKKHDDVRKHILANGSITKITKAGRIFKGVYSPVITMEIIKNGCSSAAGSGFIIEPDFTFNINVNRIDSTIIDKIYSVPHTTLKDRASWALGIVTGDNDRWVIQSQVQPSDMEPVIRGSDIQPGEIRRPVNFIRFEPDRFQQTAPEWKYRAAEKLVYRFISKKLIFALDTGARLTLNSANIIIPEIKGLSAAEIMQLFNSDLYNFIFRKRFNSVKVLRSHLEQLPLPINYSGNRPPAFLSTSEIEHIRNEMQN